MTLKRQALTILVIVIGIAVISTWIFLITPHIINQIDGYDDFFSYSGLTSDLESLIDGKPPIPIYVIYKHDFVGENNGIIEFLTSYTNYNTQNNEILWQTTQTNFVDKKTGLFIEPANTYFQFPRNTQKQNYLVYVYDNGDPQPFVFEEEVTFDGLNVYRFSCKLTAADLSQFYTEFYPAKVFSDYECNAWIEPITGDQIEYEENWNDYILQNDTEIPVEIAYTQTTEFAKQISIENTLNKINLFEIYEKLIPTIFSITVSGICAVIIFYIHNKQKV